MKPLIIFTIIAFLSYQPLGMTQDIVKDAPIEITADEAIEWLRDENLYRARGNAMATQGKTSISTDMLSAFYDPENNKTITEIHADGNVVIQNSGQKAVGDKGVYNVKTHIMRLTGGNLSVTTSKAAVTAQNSLEYDTKQRKALARGNAQASDGENTIKASTLTVWLMNNAQGKTVLKKVTATGKVRIETPTEIILGDKGDYNAVTETATVEGNVRITRDGNQLSGDRATVDLKTGISQILSSPDDGNGEKTRVRALFYPSNDATPLGSN